MEGLHGRLPNFGRNKILRRMLSWCGGLGNYAARHDPFVYFGDIVDSQSRCSQIVQANSVVVNTSACNAVETPDVLLNELSSSSSAKPANFMWLTPNTDDDGHDCGSGGTQVPEENLYLNNLVPQILGSFFFANNRAALILTFDECDSCPNSGPLYFVIAGSGVKQNYSSSVHYNHYATLHTEEYNWQLQCFATNDCNGGTMSEFFTPPAPIQVVHDPTFQTSESQVCNDSTASSNYPYWHPNVHNSGAGCVTISGGQSQISETSSGTATWNNPDSPTVQSGSFPWQTENNHVDGAAPMFNYARNTWGLDVKSFGQYPLYLNTSLALPNPAPSGSMVNYHIFIGFYFWLPDGVLGGTDQIGGNGQTSQQWIEAQVRFGDKENGVSQPVGTEKTWKPGDAFGYSYEANQLTSGTLTVTNFNITSFYLRSLAVWGLPSSTRGLLAGVEVGLEGVNTTISVNFSSVSLHTLEFVVVHADVGSSTQGRPFFDQYVNIVDVATESNSFSTGPNCSSPTAYGTYYWYLSVNSDGCINILEVAYVAYYFQFTFP